MLQDEFYIFIGHVEMSARNILNTNLMKKYGGESIQNLLMSEFSKNNLIDLCWSSITSRIENETLKSTLKSEVLKKWINIRGNTFARAWVDTLKKGQFEKQKQNKKIVSKKGEGSLRKQLSVEE